VAYNKTMHIASCQFHKIQKLLHKPNKEKTLVLADELTNTILRREAALFPLERSRITLVRVIIVSTTV
jgi:hypothetical protein